MKRLITIATSSFVVAVGGAMLATPIQAATTSFSCSETDLLDAQRLADEYCGGRFQEAYVSCPAGGTMTIDVRC